MINGEVLSQIAEIVSKVKAEEVFISKGRIICESENGIMFLNVREVEDLGDWIFSRKIFVKVFSLFGDRDEVIIERGNAGWILKSGELIVDMAGVESEGIDIDIFQKEGNEAKINIEGLCEICKYAVADNRFSDMFNYIYVFKDGVYVAIPSMALRIQGESNIEVGISPDLLRLLEPNEIENIEVLQEAVKISFRKGDLDGVFLLKAVEAERGKMIKEVIEESMRMEFRNEVVIDEYETGIKEVSDLIDDKDIVRINCEGDKVIYTLEKDEVRIKDILGRLKGEEFECAVGGMEFKMIMENVILVRYAEDKIVVKGEEIEGVVATM